jgi:hypothetical protein
MPTVKDIIVTKPTEEQIAECKSWPIWSKGPSTFEWSYTQQETCLVLEGKVMVSDENDSVTFGPGDMVVFPVELDCTWQITQAVRKHYNFE